ncbi:MAG: CCA tRNA nucleotidyltransferase [Phycisphaerae bacterium]
MAATSSRSAALWVVRTLREAGYQALFAGGCVRDMLLGRPSSDYDVATDATPEDVKRLFRRVLLVGAKFGVAVVLRGRQQVEVATFRSDLAYVDGRRPGGVEFSCPREDALRRDFTINGMFYDPIEEQVIDYVGGQEDIAAGVVRTIGEPHDRFGEDYLRMMRAVRFTVRLDFYLDPAAAEAIGELAPRITAISGERIFDELSKMLALPSGPEALALLGKLGLARHILPELFTDGQPLWDAGLARAGDVGERGDVMLTLAALLCDLPGKTIAKITRRWGASNDFREGLRWLARHSDDWRRLGKLSLADLKRLRGCEHCSRLEPLMWSREMRGGGSAEASQELWRRVWSIPPRSVDPWPLLSGGDLMKMGAREGPTMGRILRAVREAQLNEDISTRREAKALAKELLTGE